MGVCMQVQQYVRYRNECECIALCIIATIVHLVAMPQLGAQSYA